MKKSRILLTLFFYLVIGVSTYWVASIIYEEPDQSFRGTVINLPEETEFKEKVPVTLVSNITHTSFYIDGERQSTLANRLYLGEVPVGATIEGKADFYWGEMKSEKQTIQYGKKEYDITPNIPVMDKGMKTIFNEIIHTFAKERLLILVNKNPDLLTNVSDQLKNRYIEQMANTRIIEAKSKDVIINLKGTIYEQGPDYTDKLVVPVTFVNQITTEDGRVPEEVTQEVKLTLLYEQAYRYWEVIEEEEL
ncbi:TcaA 3rd/4th domain-containing protein [Aquibacillus kalidii]|uniref:TcaA 3rd/4th domain-containing protein n=1 Tax=Aquibacillus kalidii TaxID=2762597 RepID=UPI0016470832|nr:hypothetical protein [Aquibacillus kalidii]